MLLEALKAAALAAARVGAAEGSVCSTAISRCSSSMSQIRTMASSSKTMPSYRVISVSKTKSAAGAAAEAAEASAAGAAASTSGSGTAAAGFIVTEAPGGKKPLQSWEKVYWGAIAVGVCGIAWYYTDDLRSAKDPEEEERKYLETREKRLHYMRGILTGRHWLEGEDPFEGLRPSDIDKFLDMYKDKLNPDDPFEGMSPEEIDEYVATHGAPS